MAKHNFLKHYADGKEKPVELKPVDISKKERYNNISDIFCKTLTGMRFFRCKKDS